MEIRKGGKSKGFLSRKVFYVKKKRVDAESAKTIVLKLRSQLSILGLLLVDCILF